MNKRIFAAVAVTMLLQSAALAAETKDTEVKETTTVVTKAAKKKGSFISKLFSKKDSNSKGDDTKSIAAAETVTGAY